MKNIMVNDKFAVYDDVYSDDQFKLAWEYVQAESYASPLSSGWMKVWRPNDGQPLGSNRYKHSEAPFNLPMDDFHSTLLDISNRHSELIGEWKEITMRAYIYGRGTKLSWHNDAGYAAAAVLYVHPYWGSTWGGELMIAHTPEGSPGLSHLDHRREDQFLGAIGVGQYITCKPNRLVLQRENIWHQINRVDDDAGDHCRAALVAFFEK